MTFYHGSRTAGLTEILPISATGSRGPTDPDRDNFRDVVFLTTSLEAARRYAGKDGTVYQVSGDAEPYVDAYERHMASVLSKSRLRQKLNKLRAREGLNTFIATSASVVGVIS